MSNTFFTADLHFGHGNIAKYCNRLFCMNDYEKSVMASGDSDKIKELRISQNSIDKHDETLIQNFNSKVKQDDTVYILGDFAFRDCSRYFNRLNGKKHIIFGNHDKDARRHAYLFESAQDYKEIKIDGQDITLCHYAMRVFNKSHYGTFQLYGHSHGTLPDDPHSLSFDVGVDCHDYYPISFKEVKVIMSKKLWKPIDHHGERQEGGGVGLSKEEYQKMERKRLYLSLKREFE